MSIPLNGSMSRMWRVDEAVGLTEGGGAMHPTLGEADRAEALLEEHAASPCRSDAARRKVRVFHLRGEVAMGAMRVEHLGTGHDNRVKIARIERRQARLVAARREFVTRGRVQRLRRAIE